MRKLNRGETADRERGTVEAPRQMRPGGPFRAARDERDGSSPLSDDLRPRP